MINFMPGIAFRPENLEFELRPRYSYQTSSNSVSSGRNNSIPISTLTVDRSAPTGTCPSGLLCQAISRIPPLRVTVQDTTKRMDLECFDILPDPARQEPHIQHQGLRPTPSAQICFLSVARRVRPYKPCQLPHTLLHGNCGMALQHCRQGCPHSGYGRRPRRFRSSSRRWPPRRRWPRTTLLIQSSNRRSAPTAGR